MERIIILPSRNVIKVKSNTRYVSCLSRDLGINQVLNKFYFSLQFQLGKHQKVQGREERYKH